MKILHIADLHWSTKHLSKCINSSIQIETIAKDEKPELIIISGDLQDSILTVEDETAYAPMLKHIQILADISPIVILYGNDNHDAPKSLDPIKLLETKYPIHISDYPETIWLRRLPSQFSAGYDFINTSNDPSWIIATIHTLPYPTKEFLLREQKENQQIDNLNQLAIENLKMIFIGMQTRNIDGIPTILAFHGNVSDSKISNGQTISTHAKDIIIRKDDLELSGADYIAGGHIHLNQMFSPKGGYAGSTYHVNWGETEKKFVNCVEIEPGKLPKIKAIELTSTRPMVKHECQLVGGQILYSNVVISNPDEPVNDWQGADLRVRVTMDEEQRKTYDENIVKQFYAGAFSYQIEPETIYVERSRSENIGRATNLVDQFKEWATAVNKEDKITEDVMSEIHEIELEYNKKGMYNNE